MVGSAFIRSLARYIAAGAVATILLTGCAAPPLQRADLAVPPTARPNGIAVSQTDGTVLIADDASDTVLASRNGQAFQAFASLPSEVNGPSSWSQLTTATDGTVFIQRFGFGRDGAVFALFEGQPAAVLTGLDTQKRRLGLISIGNGRLLSTWVMKQASGQTTGGVSLLLYHKPMSIKSPLTSIAAVERDVVLGLGKPVGIAQSGDFVYISDQTMNHIIKVRLQDISAQGGHAASSQIVAQLSAPDLMSVDGRGDLYTKCEAHDVCRITPTGEVSIEADGLHDPRGVAIDRSGRQLYVVDRAPRGQPSSIRIIPSR